MDPVIRTIAHLSSDELQEMNLWVGDDGKISKIRQIPGGYHVWFTTGEYMFAKGHYRVSGLARIKETTSTAQRIKRYGGFGSTIN